MSEDLGIPIPPDALAPETLRNVIEEYVTRDGTDLVDADRKVEQVLALLRSGRAQIWFDEKSGTCNVLEH